MVITYVNCTAELKAMSDIVCTSSNAVQIVESLPKDQKIIFGPDRNLGAYVAKKTGRDLVLWNGACMVHEIFSQQKILKLRNRHPEAKFIAHPECEDVILKMADYIGSTTGLLKYTIRQMNLLSLQKVELSIKWLRQVLIRSLFLLHLIILVPAMIVRI
jgi:quinolinate synthase